jgi:hypothetical protein
MQIVMSVFRISCSPHFKANVQAMPVPIRIIQDLKDAPGHGAVPVNPVVVLGPVPIPGNHVEARVQFFKISQVRRVGIASRYYRLDPEEFVIDEVGCLARSWNWISGLDLSLRVPPGVQSLDGILMYMCRSGFAGVAHAPDSLTPSDNLPDLE